MEPVTHMLTGAVLARASGINRRAAYATVAMVIAAEMPDMDVVWSLGGPVAGLEHHRGITHTFLALPFEAAALTAAFWAWNRWRAIPAVQTRVLKPAAPPNWTWLYAGCLLALLSHLLLDWTNNYGLRPFFPFNPRWYAGSFVFIFEPVLFALLLGALVMPWLFGLVASEVGSRRPAFRGRGWAIAALIGIAALYGFRDVQHDQAIRLARLNGPPDATRTFASPHPLNPFEWSTVSDTPGFYQLATVDTRRQIVLPPEPSDTLYKPPASLPLLAAKRTYLGRIYLDWSMYPVLTETPDTSDPRHPLTTVMFSDARFLYATAGMDGRANPPISATVTLDMEAPDGDRVVETRMGNRLQK